jgi:hypothetical protein
MPLGSFSRRRGRVAFPLWIALATSAWLSCSAPDGSGLYEPYGSSGAGSGGAGAGAAGSGGSGSSSGGAAAGGNSAGVGGEGPGGNLPLAGAAGAGGSSFAGTASDAGVSLFDAGSFDAGPEPDAGPPDPPPDACEPSDEVCDGLDNNCDGVIDSGVACPDGCSGFTLEGHAYMFCEEAVDRGIALARCGGEGMKLAWIETPGENAALLATITDLGLGGADELVVQIGASDEDDEDEWFWIGNDAAFDGFQFWEGNAAEDGGETVDAAYANWADGEPNNQNTEDCGLISITGNENRAPGQWDDRSCLDELPFLCEQP